MALLTAQSLLKLGYDVTLYTFDYSPECFPEIQKGLDIQVWDFQIKKAKSKKQKEGNGVGNNSPLKFDKNFEGAGGDIKKSPTFTLLRKPLRIATLAYHLRHVDIIFANNPPMHIVAALAKVCSLRFQMTKGRNEDNEEMMDCKSKKVLNYSLFIFHFSLSTLWTIWWHHHTPWYLSKKMTKGRDEGNEGMKGGGNFFKNPKLFIIHYSLFITKCVKGFIERHFIIPLIDHMIATSHFVAGQIQEYCGREAQVVHPVTIIPELRGIDDRKGGAISGIQSETVIDGLDPRVTLMNENISRVPEDDGLAVLGQKLQCNNLGNTNTSNLVLFTHGRLEPGKGLDTIVRISKRLQAMYNVQCTMNNTRNVSNSPLQISPEIGEGVGGVVRLLVAGSGSLESWLREQGAEVIPFEGVRTLGSLKSGLTLALYASTIDAFGLTALESQLAGLSTIILDSGGARETILSDVSGEPVGHLVESEEALFASICYFAEHKLFPKPVSIVNFSHTRDYFSPSRLDRDIGLLMSRINL